jgi:AcrR family transcriptional regulator
MANFPEPLMSGAGMDERRSRTASPEDQRDDVMTAAIGVFAKRSYVATTVDHIVAAAKIGVGTFYALFEDKGDCFLAAYDRTVASARERIDPTLPVDGSQPERVLTALRGLAELIAADPMSARLVLEEAQTAGPAALARHEANLDALVPELELLRESSPVAAELPQTLDMATLGGVVWFLQQRIAGGEVDDPAALLRQLAEIVLEPYIGRSETEALLVEAGPPGRLPGIEAQ